MYGDRELGANFQSSIVFMFVLHSAFDQSLVATNSDKTFIHTRSFDRELSNTDEMQAVTNSH